MELRLTILCENSVARPGRCIGEHGFACHVATPHGNWLFDTGQGLGLLRNAEELGCDLCRLDGIVLSHGHYDHGGGLPAVLALRDVTNVHIHPELFVERYWLSPFERRSIGLPFTRADAENLGARFIEKRGWSRLADTLWLSGEIPRTTHWESGDPHLIAVTQDGDRLDPLSDDQALVADTSRGLVVLLGCAHAGLVNTLEHVRSRFVDRPIHAVVGGTHLGPASDEQFAASVQALRRFGVVKLGTSHCTGLPRSATLAREYGGQHFYASVGCKFEV